MTQAVPDARLAPALWECDRHRAALDEALSEWQALDTPSSQALEQDSSLRRLTDQIIYRFTKLQDAMGERLVPAVLSWLREPHEAGPPHPHCYTAATRQPVTQCDTRQGVKCNSA